MGAIEIQNLTIAYPQTVAVHGLSLDIPIGRVSGFVAANGAGKTTTMKAIVGHLPKWQTGRIKVLGASVRGALNSVIDRVGCLIEGPAFDPRMSGYASLVELALLRGFPRVRVDAVLDQVGLADAASRRCGTYSLGMLQRLGLAQVLLKDPELLILDEPTNGLDPEGVRWLRDLLRHLAREGRTVFISSHGLAELENCCDELTVIDRGRTISSGPLATLLRRERLLVRVDTQRIGVAAEALHRAGLPVAREDDHMLVDCADGAAVNAVLFAAGVVAHELRPIKATLEDYFLEVTESPQ